VTAGEEYQFNFVGEAYLAGHICKNRKKKD
jgi:hypothetical protein